jgi:RNA polymerase sigma factor (sigma-70 family)
MADERLYTLVRHLRRATAPPSAAGLRDGELLERFLRERDEAAFELLLWRHGPMVLGTCRRLLRHQQDAEDAFQATFLVLLRKARSVSRGEALGAWLYRVAHRVALRARAAAQRRARRERPGFDTAAVPAPPAAAWDDLRPVLDEEVSRLPARERSAFVLCCLQGKTHAEAGRELGCPEGTVSWRLSRARERLRGRLVRRGVALSAAALAGVVSANATAAPLPAALVSTALRAALLGGGARAAAAGAMSSSAAALTEGVLQAMLLRKVKGVAAVVLALAAAGAGGTALSYRAAAGPAQAGPTARLAPRRADADAQQIEALKQENAALRAQVEQMRRQLDADRAKLKQAVDQAMAEAHRALEQENRAKRIAEFHRQALTEKAPPAKANSAQNNRQRENDQLRELAERSRVEAQAMQQEWKAKVAALEQALAKERDVAQQARAEALAMRDQLVRANKLAEDRAVRANAAEKDVRGAAARKARDEVELLQAQMDIRKAELVGAKAGLDLAQTEAARLQGLARKGTVEEAIVLKAQTEAARARAQVLVKEAELKAAEVALQQAMRRQREAEGGPGAAAAPDGREQRLKELEARLDALRREIQSLRQGAGPNKP